MLARTTKTAAQLGISEKEREGLAWVRDQLRSGLIEDWWPRCEEGPRQFDMMCTMSSCGTVGCIGGWLGVRLGKSLKEADHYVQSHADPQMPMYELFYAPDLSWILTRELTGLQAAQAIDNFLETGDPCWHGAVLTC